MRQFVLWTSDNSTTTSSKILLPWSGTCPMLGATVSLGSIQYEMMDIWALFGLHSLIAYLGLPAWNQSFHMPSRICARPRKKFTTFYKHHRFHIHLTWMLVYANNIYDAQLPFSNALMVELNVMTFGCSSRADLRSNCHTLGIVWHGLVSRPKMFNVQQPTQKQFDWNLAVWKLVHAT